jgi:hypothetical protein
MQRHKVPKRYELDSAPPLGLGQGLQQMVRPLRLHLGYRPCVAGGEIIRITSRRGGVTVWAAGSYSGPHQLVLGIIYICVTEVKDQL